MFRLFEKVDHWINKEDQTDNDAKKRLDDATQVSDEDDPLDFNYRVTHSDFVEMSF